MRLNDKITIFKNGKETLFEVTGSHTDFEHQYRIFMVSEVESPQNGYFVGVLEPINENGSKIMIPFINNNDGLFSEHPSFRRLKRLIEFIKESGL